MSVARPPIVWTIAGSDSGGGAGLQADLKAFEAFGVHGCSAVAALTAQHSCAVERVEPVSASMLEAQLAALARDLPPAALKTGLLGSIENVHVVARWADRLRVPLVVDPVLGATTGAAFADEALVAAYRQVMLPRATLTTPNGREAARLGEPPFGRAGVVTGGDDGGACAADRLHSPQCVGALTLPRIDTPHHHGSGCVFAASAAAALALGFVEAEAAVLAKMSTAHALRRGYAAGAGAGPVRPGPGFARERRGLPELGGPAVRGFRPLPAREIGLYAVVDSAAWVERVLALGVRTVQLRIKGQPRGLRDEVRAAVRSARTYGARLFVNDHWALAVELGAHGVHLGQEDLEDADLAAVRDAGLHLGVSTHAMWEVCRALALVPSYLACGPVHATQLKAMPWTPQGEHNLAFWCDLLAGVPVVAIGGLDAPRARDAARCGAAGVAVVGAITRAADPAAAVHALQAAFADGRREHAAGRGHAVPALPRPTLAPGATGA